jgi:hypothetical protein
MAAIHAPGPFLLLGPATLIGGIKCEPPESQKISLERKRVVRGNVIPQALTLIALKSLIFVRESH